MCICGAQSRLIFMVAEEHPPRILVISQVYVPDSVSVGQHMADAAEKLASRGFDVECSPRQEVTKTPRSSTPLANAAVVLM